MTVLYLDTETYCEIPIRRGTYRYAEDVEILLWAWAIDNGPIQVDETLTDELRRWIETAHVIVMHKSDFDRNVIKSAASIDIPVKKIHDTMVQAMAHSLPGGLDKLCDIFKVPVEHAKQKRGKQLIQLFCKPRPKTSKIRRATKHTHKQEWRQFIDYAGSDIASMRYLKAKMPTWNYNGPERTLWELDQKINDRGIKVDLTLAKNAVATVAREQKRLSKVTQDITDNELQSTRQRDKMLAHLLAHYGVNLPDLQKGTLERRVEDPDLPEPVRELLRIRLQAATSSTSKYQALLNSVNGDGRVRGTLQFCGALRTGRWAGRIFQPQNLPRPNLKQDQIDDGIDAFHGDYADLIADNVMKLASNCIRGCFVASPGAKLVATDLSNIEGRVLAWLADEQWKLDAFRQYDAGTGPDLYKLAYARSFNKPLAQISDDDRQIGKVQELALGYQGAVGAFSIMAMLYGVDLTESTTLKIVRAWRHANSNIKQLWYDLQNVAVTTVLYPTQIYECGKLKLRRDGAWLRIILPSGRALCYPAPKVGYDDKGRPKLSYMGVNSYTRKWERIPTYGGKLVENCTQAIARDVMAAAMPLAEKAGYDILLTVHDELIAETPDFDTYSAHELSEILATNPYWAEGLPLAAEGFEAYRYRKN